MITLILLILVSILALGVWGLSRLGGGVPSLPPESPEFPATVEEIAQRLSLPEWQGFAEPMQILVGDFQDVKMLTDQRIQAVLDAMKNCPDPSWAMFALLNKLHRHNGNVFHDFLSYLQKWDQQDQIPTPSNAQIEYLYSMTHPGMDQSLSYLWDMHSDPKSFLK